MKFVAKVGTALSLLALSVPAMAEGGQPDKAAQIERGKYLVTIAGCNDCHTPLKMGPKGPEPDMSRMLSGHPADMQLPPPPKMPDNPWGVAITMTLTSFSGPWGISYAANLTPDDETGLGRWNEANFIGALREGKHAGAGRPILPPMPWMWIGQATDEDLKAMFAYLQSIPAIKNAVPAAVIAPPPPAGGEAPKK